MPSLPLLHVAFVDCWKVLEQMSTMQVAAVEALTAVVESQLVAGSDVVELLLPSVLANINVVGSPDEVCMQDHLEPNTYPSLKHASLQALYHAPCLMMWLALYRSSMPG